MNEKKETAVAVETAVIHTQTPASHHREHSSAIYMTASFTFDNAEHARALFAKETEGQIYTRYGNPNVDEFIEKMCLLEGAEAGIALASGMSAVFTAMAGLLNQGDHVLAARSVFGSTHQILTRILPRWGISHTYVEIDKPETWTAAIRPETRLCVVETPSNPALDLVDLAWLGDLCRQHNIILLVDNVFATPILQRPIELGANLVMHSATKFIDGQGRAIGGALVGDFDLIQELVYFMRHTGPSLSPFNAWLFSKGLETLPLRMERHCDNAQQLAEYLETNPHVAWVKYPHLPSHPQYELARRQMKRGGGMVTFAVKGGLEQGRRFLDALNLCTLTANLGDTRTIATHPASTTHSSLSEEERLAVGITPGLVRMSVGLEAIDDIVADIAQALAQSAA
ncbi:MAG: aminotransferase class I/II-fold pyridoxal phosphate-dependent enzyme [Ardenticatenaceae bacterium]|nr:aminotransferase class I/II-fold pyridoxal phosphate-dependent enzyme [Anaerolineales bacterium]MCB8920562.1 aminotransferase class I/II-fold pyridoxal phosphate-dependent enzyme [Ardenticatenaceae bacterium]MCB8990185.1 aminotransferase class I/II-fold pyridoxal phosphate-dependent enzyme [Ardenticatenaceae bacterium]MCB9003024.1 aminotransferase class I/II-fold pyridoxal phosphate-dependent enzyme [Ardenticatenaceae bacterium]